MAADQGVRSARRSATGVELTAAAALGHTLAHASLSELGEAITAGAERAAPTYGPAPTPVELVEGRTPVTHLSVAACPWPMNSATCCEHDFSLAMLNVDGSRQFDRTKEKHADHFACQLLVPDSDAVWAGFQDFSNADVAEHFDVSEQFASWRMSRARIIVQRHRAKIA